MNAVKTKVGIDGLLESLGHAISTNDQWAIADCFETPAMFVGERVMTLSSAEELKTLFANGRKFYEQQGIVSTRPILEKVEQLTDSLLEVTASWPGFDASGKECWTERSRYVVRLDLDGEPRIRVAITLGGKQV